MTEKEFVVEDFNEFLEFARERSLTYQFVELMADRLYAYILGSKRVAYIENSKNETDLKKRLETLRKAGFIYGHERTVVA